MKALLLTLALGFSLVASAQHRGASKNRYDINYSAKELAAKVDEPRVSLFEGLLSNQEAEFSVSVNSDMHGLTLQIFPDNGTRVDDNAAPKSFAIRSRRDRDVVASGRVNRLGNNQFFMDITMLPKGNYILTVDGLQTGQPITFSNY